MSPSRAELELHVANIKPFFEKYIAAPNNLKATKSLVLDIQKYLKHNLNEIVCEIFNNFVVNRRESVESFLQSIRVNKHNTAHSLNDQITVFIEQSLKI